MAARGVRCVSAWWYVAWRCGHQARREVRTKLRTQLKRLGDMERCVQRVVMGRGACARPLTTPGALALTCHVCVRVHVWRVCVCTCVRVCVCVCGWCTAVGPRDLSSLRNSLAAAVDLGTTLGLHACSGAAAQDGAGADVSASCVRGVERGVAAALSRAAQDFDVGKSGNAAAPCGSASDSPKARPDGSDDGDEGRRGVSPERALATMTAWLRAAPCEVRGCPSSPHTVRPYPAPCSPHACATRAT